MPKPPNPARYETKNFAVIDGKTGAVTAAEPKINLASLDECDWRWQRSTARCAGKFMESGEGARLVSSCALRQAA